jgi:uncharacterized protein (TIGR03085 family)
VGPDARTLCEGWTASDVAIHLVLIERHPESWLGIPLGNRIPRTRRYFDGLVDTERARPWPELVERMRTGPQHGPWANAAIRNRMQFRELIVHGEDVRRANGIAPNDLGPAVREATWKKAKFFSRFVKTAKPYGLEIADPEGRVHRAREGVSYARVTGEPVDLLLYEFGRSDAASVTFSGDDDAIASLTIRSASAPSLPRTR